MGSIIARREPGEKRVVVVGGIKVDALVAVGDLVPSDRIIMAVRGDDAMISHVGNGIVANLVLVSKHEIDAIQAILHDIITHLVSRAESKFDRIVERALDGIADNRIVVSARDGMGLDKHTVPILAGDRVPPHHVVA